ncbi:MAG: thioredoxin family protein [Patescibacteria group bacterium]
MSTKAIIIGLFSILVVGSGIFVATRGDTDMTATEPSPTPTGTPSASSTATAAPVQAADRSAEQRVAGTYVDYREGILGEAAGQRVLFFHAPWCPQCRSIERGIRSEGVPDGYTIIKVDYDSHQDLRRKYGVRIQTSFVKVDGSGDPQGDVYVAYDEPTFEAVKRNFLD